MEQTETGYLIVNVRTARGAMPIAGAMVTITSSGSAGYDVVAVVQTDSGGSTPKIALSAPASGASQQPGTPVPYAKYNIDTDKAGFYGVRNVNVPVYAGITSVQPVELIPLALGDEQALPEEDIYFNEAESPNL